MASADKWDALRKRLAEVPTVDILGFMGVEYIQIGGELKIKCFQPGNHNNGDAKPSLTINPRTGKWFCFVCKVGGPDILSLLVKKFPKRSPRFILEDTCHQFIHPVVPSDAVDECHKRLMSTQAGEDFRKALKDRRGFPEETIVTFKLGLDDSRRITIPVMGPYGLYQDLRRWDAFRFDPAGLKFLAWAKGFGKASAGKWWPAEPAGISPVIFEGEPDTILGRTLGLDGVTVISGASQFDKLDSVRWQVFTGKSVTIIPDADKAGQSALGTILRELTKAGVTKVRVAVPPKPSKDFTEWVMAKSVASVLATIEQTPWQTPDSAASPLPPAALRDITRPEAVNVPISFNGQVSRVAMQPSLLPKRFKVTCNGDKESLCPSCPNMAQGCAGVYEVQLTDDAYIDTLDQPSPAVVKTLKHHAKVPSECKVSVEVLDHYGAIHAVLIPHTGKIDRSVTDHVTRDVVYCGDFLMAGSASRFHGYTRPDPKTQKAITVITKAQDNARPWQNYKIPRCEADALATLFDRRDPYHMLKWMASKISKYYTKVVGRDLLHMVIDVALHSALEIPIAGQSEPGFMDVAIVGNSSCVVGDTYVYTTEGLIHITNVKPGDTVETKNGPCVVGKFHDNGPATPTLRVTTKKGFHLEGTLDHPIWTPTGWTRLDALKPETFVGILRGARSFGKDIKHFQERVESELHLQVPELAMLMGYIIGNGTFSPRTIQILYAGRKDSQTVENFLQLVARAGFHAVLTHRENNTVKYRINGLRPALIRLGLIGNTGRDKRIPDFVLEGSKETQRSFLRGYFDADGHHDLKGNIELTTCSHLLADQTQLILLGFGIVASCKTKTVRYAGEPRPYYRLIMSGLEADKFLCDVGFVSDEKQQSRHAIQNRGACTQDFIPGADVLVKQLWKLFRKSHPEVRRRTQNISTNPSIYWIMQVLQSKIRVSRKFTNEFLAMTKEFSGLSVWKHLHDCACDNVFWDEIVSIEKGQAKTYDLHVPVEHSFISNGVISHNTGKGKSAEGILRMLGAGEIVSGKRATVAGLIGGTVRHQQGYDVAIGVFSLRDGEAVVIDEGTKPDVFREMTRARREGLAEFTQAGISHTANARCRKIWLLNAPHPKHMGSYRFGIEVLRDLVAAEEDVARWDLAVGVLSDVDEKLIDAASLPLTDEAPISLATLRARLFWAWSRKVQDIHIEKSARDAISECLSDLVKRYETSAVGLIQKGNTHVKLRKGAVAVALATFSTKDGVNVLVSDKHVRAYAQIIRDALDAPALRLGEMVLANKGSGQIDDMPAVINIFKRLRTRSAARRFLQAKPGPVFSWEALVPEKENPRETIRSLIRHGALLDTKGEVQATKEFGDFLQKLVGMNGTPQM